MKGTAVLFDLSLPSLNRAELLRDLRAVRDFLSPELWPSGLRAVAEKHGLSAAVLEPVGVAG